jgi:hypothetical protein
MRHETFRCSIVAVHIGHQLAECTVVSERNLAVPRLHLHHFRHRTLMFKDLALIARQPCHATTEVKRRETGLARGGATARFRVQSGFMEGAENVPWRAGGGRGVSGGLKCLLWVSLS